MGRNSQVNRSGFQRSEEEAAVPAASAASRAAEDVPLVVDLDGTLVNGDTLLEGVLSLIRHRPACILMLPVWALRGRAALKANIAKRFQLDATTLGYRGDLLEYLQSEQAKGRRLILATAANENTAANTSQHLKLFDEVFASTESVNLKGKTKRDKLVERFGPRGFDYIGDSKSDTPIWAACRIGHIAGSMDRLPSAALAAGATQGRVFASRRPKLKTWVRAMRPHQWVKNLLVFAPTLLNHRLNGGILKSLILTFFAFSFVSSATYINNDLFDLAADRQHPRKSKRPLASGDLSISRGILLSFFLLISGFCLGAVVGLPLEVCLVGYLLLTSLYSSFLKGKPIIDVIALASLYTLRLYAGGVVSKSLVSPWLFQFSIFLFISLAFVKRYSELRRLFHEGREAAPGRNYRSSDLSIISQAGLTAGLMAGLVLALYVNAGEIQRLYPKPEMLWGLCPLFVYWISRVWLVAHRGNMHEDPIIWAFRDRVSYIVGFLMFVSMLLAATKYSY
jgi:4-hydroxybenzoate polyprenyltransferase